MNLVDPEDVVQTLVRGRVEELPDGTFTVTVIEGPGAGALVELDGSSPSRLLVGTSPACDLQLVDREVSRRHLALEPRGDRLRITDLGSTNGTEVDGVTVLDAWLRGGETIRIGGSRLRVDRHPEGANAPVPSASSFGRVLGASRAMRRLYPLCTKLARSDVAIVIEGETGTGKEVLAESLHDASSRAAAPFVVFDCAATAPALIEAELFGHEQGAFPGAIATRRGVFEQASGGTLLIDEIGDLDLPLQPKLLRALERGEIRRVGGEGWIKVDVRVIAATRRDLDRAVQEGRFRDDLFHRIAVGRVELPPLRDRIGDVVLLASHFWEQLGGAGEVPPRLLARWKEAPWPGNVRELRNAVARAVVLGGDGPATDIDNEEEPLMQDRGSDLDRLADVAVRSGEPIAVARQRVIDAFEERYLERILAVHQGNVTHAAAAAGVARRHLQRLRARRRT
ncbi:Response regulator of zinc sigma-54-dependent two-component system [Minicystis rosea]|nr:Response regulator of zinc sigma-54-dependent two-component system [Minicystis rosea]